MSSFPAHQPRIGFSEINGSTGFLSKYSFGMSANKGNSPLNPDPVVLIFEIHRAFV